MSEKYKKTEDRKLFLSVFLMQEIQFVLSAIVSKLSGKFQEMKNLRNFNGFNSFKSTLKFCFRRFVMETWKMFFQSAFFFLTLEAPTSQNGQTHSNNSSAVTDALFECVWPFREAGSWRDHVTVNAFVLIPKPRVKIVTTSQILWTISFFNGLVMVKKIHHSATPFLKYGDVR